MPAPDTPALSIVIPAYNEAKRLPRTLETVLGYLDRRGVAAEVLVVDNGSTDTTPALAREWAQRDRRVRALDTGGVRGKGVAVRTGMRAARGVRVLFSDADLATPIEEVEKLETELDRGAGVAIASRALPGSDIQVHQSALRETMGRAFNRVVQMLAAPGIVDTQCGFKLFTADAARRIFAVQWLNGFAFDVEAVFLARRMGFRVAEVPVVWRHDADSKVRMWRDGITMLWDIVTVRWAAWRGRYNERP